MGRQLIHQLPVPGKELFRLVVTAFQGFHHFRIHIRRRPVAAGQAGAAAQVFAFHRGKPHQSKTLAHTKPGYHVGGDIRSLLDIVGSSRGDISKNDFLRSASPEKAYQPVVKLILGLKVLLLLRHMHDISQSAHGSWHNGDLLHRLGILLQGADQRMAHLVIGDDFALFLTHDAVFLLLAHQNLLHRVEQILLVHVLSSVLYRIDRRLVDHIRKIRTHRAAGCKGDGVQIHAVVQMHILGVHLENRNSSLQIRLIHYDPSVKTARAKQRFVQNFRTVGGSQHQNSLGGVKAVHLGKQLIQRLLPLLVAAAVFIVPAPADRVNLINKYNAGRILGGLLKQIPHPGSAHAHVQFDKIRTGERKERNLRLPCHRLCQQGLSGTGRSHQQRSLGKLGSDPGIFAGIMQEIHYLLQGFLRLILPCHILEGDSRLLLHINLGVALANAHGPAAL